MRKSALGRGLIGLAASCLTAGCFHSEPGEKAAPRWEAVDSSLSTHRLQALHFANADTGFAVGEKVVRTVDGGGTWTVLDAGSETALAVFFLDGRRGWVAGTRGEVFRTTNAGETWTRAASGSGANLRAIVFVDSLNGYCAGEEGFLARSRDGGATWTARTFEGGPLLHALDFPSADTGFATGDDGWMRRTVDAGGSWEPLNPGTPQDLYAVQFLDTRTGYAAAAGEGYGGVYKTTDGGNTWLDVGGASKGSQGHLALYFADVNIGWVAGDYGAIYATRDGGATWTPEASSRGNTLSGIAVPAPGRGWAVEQHYGLIRRRGGVPGRF